MPWYADLELARHGACYIEPELNVAMIRADGPPLEWWTDFERTAASFDSFSSRDAATLRRWREAFLPIVDKILLPESRTPPLPAPRRRELLERSAEGRLIAARIAGLCGRADDLQVFDTVRNTYRAAGFGDVAILFRALSDVYLYEEELRKQGKELKKTTLEEMDRLWEEAKKQGLG